MTVDIDDCGLFYIPVRSKCYGRNHISVSCNALTTLSEINVFHIHVKLW